MEENHFLFHNKNPDLSKKKEEIVKEKEILQNIENNIEKQYINEENNKNLEYENNNFKCSLLKKSISTTSMNRNLNFRSTLYHLEMVF